ncbi:MAG: twin-arginine translocation signal domain-containing protein [Planctomycetes bacterium]|nr:twin-arginine translocation signal domain-containing protein [Planctomycetota bacterium]
MAGDERSRPDDRRERRATRRRFLQALGAAAGAHFVLLNDWIFAGEAPPRPRTVEEDLMCNRTGNWPKESAVFEDRDCGKKLPGGGVFTDQDCGRQSPHIYPGNATWDDGDCGKKDATGAVMRDSCCGLSAPGMGGAHWDNDCGKPASPGSIEVNVDQDCNLPSKGLGRYKDNDCDKILNPPAGLHPDSFCRWWY